MSIIKFDKRKQRCFNVNLYGNGKGVDRERWKEDNLSYISTNRQQIMLVETHW